MTAPKMADVFKKIAELIGTHTDTDEVRALIEMMGKHQERFPMGHRQMPTVYKTFWDTTFEAAIENIEKNH